ncbi:MAG TPA: dTDP-4-dehydrorhamnose reductase, partial [Acidobacteriota bacterium]|nr:dTDP-4-dehydrorhamnose reductase [Acidobacteriota bacterium]
MRILLIGSTGQLGWELEKTLAPLGELTALDYPDLDLSQADGVRRFLRQKGRFQVIINAAAYTDVDRAESELGRATAVNAVAPGILGQEARDLGAAFVHYSTDYVFDGAKGSPYAETDSPAPLNAYGRTKLAGERAVTGAGGAYLIFRTSWVYGLRRDSFVTKVLEWARSQRTLRIVDDQVGNPTWARSLAEATGRVLGLAMDGRATGAGQASPERLRDYISERAGLYHLAGDGFATRLEWA